DGERAAGPDHPILATFLNNLALAHADRGEQGEARVLLERALAIDTAAYGVLHTSVGRDHHRLAETLIALGDGDGARTHLARAVEAFTGSVGADHAFTVRVRDQLAALP
ncbi:MAG TPA: tetratricopeptide repeat protein, partial [Longimicrobiaceae bacterium]|nr:tetratricopeptide repeat protein [Longimicrobiaceae bacterium]